MTPEYILRKSLCRKPWLADDHKDWQEHAVRLIECMNYAPEYAEQGYDNPKKGILFSDWNYFSKDVGDILERYGFAIEWEDEWCFCANCGKALRSNADSYMWQPSFIRNYETGEEFCHDCFSEDDIATHEDNPRTALNDHIDPAEYGYEKLEEDFENGWHPGQNDDPKKIFERLKAAGHKRLLFVIDSVGQFDMRFSIWKKKPDEETEAEKKAEQRNADHIDGYDRDDLGESPDY